MPIMPSGVLPSTKQARCRTTIAHGCPDAGKRKSSKRDQLMRVAFINSLLRGEDLMTHLSYRIRIKEL